MRNYNLSINIECDDTRTISSALQRFLQELNSGEALQGVKNVGHTCNGERVSIEFRTPREKQIQYHKDALAKLLS